MRLVAERAFIEGRLRGFHKHRVDMNQQYDACTSLLFLRPGQRSIRIIRLITHQSLQNRLHLIDAHIYMLNHSSVKHRRRYITTAPLCLYLMQAI